jgi:hypothetical protein
MGTIDKAACGRCMHHFCYECLLSSTRIARNDGRVRSRRSAERTTRVSSRCVCCSLF